MSDENVVRRVTGAVKNAVVWGVAWFALAFAAILGLRTLGVVVPSYIDWLDAMGMAIRIGVMGGITGGAFSLFISQFYHGRRLSQISWTRFGLGGAIVAGLFVPTFLVMANLMTGGGLLPFDAIRGDIVMAALFGGIAAGGSMWLAQRAEAAPDARRRERAGERVR
jgi:hypothetical protein